MNAHKQTFNSSEQSSPKSNLSSASGRRNPSRPIMRQPVSRRRWPGSLQSMLSVAFLVVAFSSSSPLTHDNSRLVEAFQQQPGEHEAAPANAPMLTLSGESSSALESAGAISSDDLIAAESSQSPEAAEHKAFTSGQLIRQEPQQHMAASVAPVFAPPQQQQQQQQQQHQQANQVQQAQMFAQPHMAARLQPPHKANFNPFMAAALAGNYGPAQQQIAAAALHAQQQGGQVGPPPPHHHQHHQPQPQVPQQHAHQAFHPQQQHPQAAHMHQHPHAPQQMIHVPHQQQQQQQHQPPPPQQQHQLQQQVQPVAQNLAVQESSIRHNIVPAPPQAQFSPQPPQAGNDEINEIPAAAGSGQTGLAVSSSAQHPVIAPAGAGVGSSSGQEAQAWPLQTPDIPKIVNLEVKCEKNLMKVSVEFDKIFNGVIFSKGHFNQGQCVHVGPQSNRQQASFDISINSCGTNGNTVNGLYGMGQNTGSGTFFENTIVIQYDPNVQEVYDHARKLRCTWHDQYEKAVTFRPFPVDMLDIVRADFAGDNVGCWMQIQVGKGPWASEVAGIVKIGQTMTMVLAIKDEENKFDMLVRNCFAHDGKRGPIELVDKSGCITRPKLMSRFTKIKNFGSSATVLSYAHFQAFKFPDSMEVHFQCTIQICRHQCPEQCASGPQALGGPGAGEAYSESTISGTMSMAPNGQTGAADSVHLRKYGQPALSRARRDASANTDNSELGDHHHHHHLSNRRWSNGSHYHRDHHEQKALTQSVGVNRIIQVVSTGDLAFAVQKQQDPRPLAGELDEPLASSLTRLDLTSNQICMSSYNFVFALILLVLIILCSTMLAVSLYLRQRSLLAAAGLKPSSASSDSSCAGSTRTSSSTLNKLFHQQDCHSPNSHHQSNYHVPSKPQQTTLYAHNQFYSGQQ